MFAGLWTSVGLELWLLSNFKRRLIRVVEWIFQTMFDKTSALNRFKSFLIAIV